MDVETARRVIEWLDRHPERVVRWDHASQTSSFLGPEEACRELPEAILSGSFDPVHDGHREMHRLGSHLLRMQVEFELPVVNADKPTIGAEQLVRRLAQFDDRAKIWLTRLPTFDLKSKVLSPAWFVVGVDTLIRIADVKYYGGSAACRDDVILNWKQQGVRFLVFGRTTEGAFRILRDLEVPENLMAICREVARSEFEMDISSSEIRREGQW